MRTLHKFWGLGLLASAIALATHAQGVLTVTPTRVASTITGTSSTGYTSEPTMAKGASLASPSAMAYDASGNLYIADSNNHAIREILKASGTLVTVAGTGIAGYAGDGGSALSAQLDTPTGIALDSNGHLYIADSHNHRVRELHDGLIETVAGTGVAGFTGDGGQAIAAQLALPSAVAFDSKGRLLIADTNNQRIRAVVNGTISTVAGNGEELFAGDGGAATAASLDQPIGIAVDIAGNLYIADSHNQRIRVVNAAGVISTFAGAGAKSFGGGFGGDGGKATAAALARPVGLAIDSNGNVLITDSNNQRLRQVFGGTILTVAGSGGQGFAGDGASLASIELNAPKGAIFDSAGNLVIADTLNERLRSGLLPTLSFADTAVGASSPGQAITLGNTGTVGITISQLALSAGFALSTGGTCTASPFVLAPGASCTQSVAFIPSSTGAAGGSVNVSGPGLVPQTVLLSGTGLQGTSVTALTADTNSALLGQSVTLTASVQRGSSGSVVFYDGGTQLGTAQPLLNHSASLTWPDLAAGTHSLTAVYSGDASFAGSTSAVVSELVGDFDFSITSGGTATGGTGSTAGNNAAPSQTVTPGQPATYALMLQPLAGPFDFPVTLSATGLPAGATVIFSPQIVNVGSAPASVTMTVHTTATLAGLKRTERYGGGAVAVALLLLPFSGKMRRRANKLGSLAVLLTLLGSGVVVTALTGCGTGTGFFGQPAKTYTIQILGTAKGVTGATLQHVATVQLTLR